MLKDISFKSTAKLFFLGNIGIVLNVVFLVGISLYFSDLAGFLAGVFVAVWVIPYFVVSYGWGAIVAGILIATTGIGSAVFMHDFQRLAQGQVVRDIPVSDVVNYPDATQFYFSDIVPLKTTDGWYAVGSELLPSAVVVGSDYFGLNFDESVFSVVPLVEKSWQPGDSITAWHVCLEKTNLFSRRVIQPTYCTETFEKGYFSATLAKKEVYLGAIEDAKQRYGLIEAEGARALTLVSDAKEAIAGMIPLTLSNIGWFMFAWSVYIVMLSVFLKIRTSFAKSRD